MFVRLYAVIIVHVVYVYELQHLCTNYQVVRITKNVGCQVDVNATTHAATFLKAQTVQHDTVSFVFFACHRLVYIPHVYHLPAAPSDLTFYQPFCLVQQ